MAQLASSSWSVLRTMKKGQSTVSKAGVDGLHPGHAQMAVYAQLSTLWAHSPVSQGSQHCVRARARKRRIADLRCPRTISG